MLDRRICLLLSTLITKSTELPTLKRLQIVLNEGELSQDEVMLKLAVDTTVSASVTNKVNDTVVDPIRACGLPDNLISPAEDLREVLFKLYATTWKARKYEMSSGSSETSPPIMVIAKHPYDWRRYGIWVKRCNRFERHYIEQLLVHGRLPQAMFGHVKNAVEKWVDVNKDITESR